MNNVSTTPVVADQSELEFPRSVAVQVLLSSLDEAMAAIETEITALMAEAARLQSETDALEVETADLKRALALVNNVSKKVAEESSK